MFGRIPGAGPALERAEVGGGRRDEVKPLVAAEHVVPNGGAAEVHVEVGVTASGAGQTVFLHLGTDMECWCDVTDDGALPRW